MAQPVLQPLAELDLDHQAGSHPLWRDVGHLVEVVMQDRHSGEWALLPMRGLQLLENDRASIRKETGAAEARENELPLAVILSEDQRPLLLGAREVPADHELFLVLDRDSEPIRCPEARPVNALLLACLSVPPPRAGI